MKLGIIGGGIVGKATARCFIEHVDEVRVWDKVKERSTHLSLGDVTLCDLVFVCLPEAVLDEFFSSTAGFGHNRPIQTNLVLRSTVPVGTTRRLAKEYSLSNLVHWPEFLTARCSLTDAHIPARNIIGYPNWKDMDVKAYSESCGFKLSQLLRRRFPGANSFEMPSDGSEAVKLIQNAFFAVKVAFFNEANRFCCDQNIEWDIVLAAVLADGRIAHSHTKVPGPDGKFGFGGACLPKDLEQWIQCVQVAGQKPLVAMAAHLRNEEDRKRAN